MHKSFHNGYIVFQWAEDNKGDQVGKNKWPDKSREVWIHLVDYQCDMLGNYHGHKHRLSELRWLEWFGKLEELHLGNLLTITTKSTIKLNWECAQCRLVTQSHLHVRPPLVNDHPLISVTNYPIPAETCTIFRAQLTGHACRYRGYRGQCYSK